MIKTIKFSLRHLPELTLGLLVVLLSYFLAIEIQAHNHTKSLLEHNTTQLSEYMIIVEGQELSNKELTNAVDNLLMESKLLKEELKKRGEKIRIVEKIVTITEGKTETIVGNFPETYQYRLKKGLLVAEHSYKKDEFTATTHSLTTQLIIVNSQDVEGAWSSSIEGTIRSSGEDKTYPLEMTALTLWTRPKSRLMITPHINAGVSIDAISLAPEAFIGVSGLVVGHTTTDDNSWRFISPYIGSNPSIGVSPVGFNIGSIKQVPLISDTWVWVGVDFDKSGIEPSIQVSSTL